MPNEFNEQASRDLHAGIFRDLAAPPLFVNNVKSRGIASPRAFLNATTKDDQDGRAVRYRVFRLEILSSLISRVLDKISEVSIDTSSRRLRCAEGDRQPL